MCLPELRGLQVVSAQLSFTIQLETKLTQLPLGVTTAVSVGRDGERQSEAMRKERKKQRNCVDGRRGGGGGAQHC